MERLEVESRVRSIGCDLLHDDLSDILRSWKRATVTFENFTDTVATISRAIERVRDFPKVAPLTEIRIELERIKRAFGSADMPAKLSEHFGEVQEGVRYATNKLLSAQSKSDNRLDRLIAEFIVWRETYIAEPFTKLPAGKEQQDFSWLKLPKGEDQKRLWVELAAEHRKNGDKRPDTQIARELFPKTGERVLRQLKTLASTEEITHWGVKRPEVINR